MQFLLSLSHSFLSNSKDSLSSTRTAENEIWSLSKDSNIIIRMLNQDEEGKRKILIAKKGQQTMDDDHILWNDLIISQIENESTLRSITTIESTWGSKQWIKTFHQLCHYCKSFSIQRMRASMSPKIKMFQASTHTHYFCEGTQRAIYSYMRSWLVLLCREWNNEKSRVHIITCSNLILSLILFHDVMCDTWMELSEDVTLTYK